MEYNYIELGNFINSAKTGGDAIKKTPIVDYETDIRCLRIGDISNKRPYSKWGYSLVEEKYKNQYLLKKNDILIARTGNTIGVGTIIKNDINSVFNNGLIRLIINEKGNPYYIYYLITSTNFKNFIYSISGGTSTQPNIKIKHLLKYMVPDLPLSKQKQFANYLLNIDKKIDLNQHIIANLEEISQTLFKRWFVDFEFLDENGNPYKSSGGEMVESELGEIPKFWNVEKAEDIYKITIGKTPPRKLTELFSENEGIDWVSISDMKTEGMFINHTKEKIVEEGIINYKVKVVPKGSVLLSFKLTIGRVKITNKELTTNEAIAHFFSDNMHQLYTYLYLKNFNFGYLGNTSSIATAINSKIVKKMPILVPKQRILAKFINRVEPFMKSIDIVQCENIKLTQLRDTLLPKLMSGEIEIPDDIEVNEDELSI